MRLLTTFTLLIICLTAIGQTSPVKKYKKSKPLTYYPGTYIDTEAKYANADGTVVIIQNSVPKGGGYTDPTGKKFGYRIFWSRVINESAIPIELTINFPADSFAMPPSPYAYLKVFLPSDTMTLEKDTLYSYGATGLKSFLDAGIHQPTMLHRTIHPREACIFYIGVLFLDDREGVARAELVLKEQNLFYKINLIDSVIPCGQIVLKH